MICYYCSRSSSLQGKTGAGGIVLLQASGHPSRFVHIVYLNIVFHL